MMTPELARWCAYAAQLDAGGVHVGTTLTNAPSVAELRQLVEAKDYVMQQLAGAFVEFSPTWIAQDRASEDAWRKDFEGLQKRYAAARADAIDAIESAASKPLPDTQIGALIEWNAILRALKQVDGTITRGDLQELDARLKAAGKQADYTRMPQPTVSSDDGIRLFQAADVLARKIEKAIPQIESGVKWVALGVTAVAIAFVWSRR